MKKFLTVLSLLVATIFSLAISSRAHALPGQATPSIDRRERRQQRRIRHGVRRGSLTRREAARLEAQQARIHRHERRARSDGRVTARERVSIQRQENRASRRIYRQKHDRQRRRY